MNKKFLGLGFTFTAQDRGLGKKLAEYSGHLQKMSESLEKINSGSFGGGGGGGGGTGQASATAAPNEPPKVKVTPEKEQKTVSMSEKTEAFFKKLKMEAGKKIFGALTEDFDEKNLDKNGNIEKKYMEKLLKNADAMVAAEKKMKLFSVGVDNLRAGFAVLSEYLKGVGSAAMQLLESFGLNLSSMIPPQISKAFELVKAIAVKPLKALFGMGKSVTDKLLTEQNAISKKFKDELNQQIGNKTAPSVKDLLQKISDGPDQDQSALSKLFNVKSILGNGLLAGVATALVLGIKNLFGGGLSGILGKVLQSKFTGIIVNAGIRIAAVLSETLPSLFTRLVTTLTSPLTYLTVAIGIWVAGFIKGVSEKFDLIKMSFSNLWMGIKSLSKGIVDVGSVLLLKLMDLIPDPVKNAVGYAFGVIVDAVVGIGNVIKTAFTDAIKAFSDVFSLVIEKVKTFAEFLSSPSTIAKKIFSNAAGVGQLFGDTVAALNTQRGLLLSDAGTSMSQWAKDSMNERNNSLRQTSEDLMSQGLLEQTKETKKTNELLEALLQSQAGLRATSNRIDVRVRTPDISGRMEYQALQSQMSVP